MMYRTLALSLASLAFVLFAGAAVPAGDKLVQNSKHDGTVVSVKGDTLVMKSKLKAGEEAKEHTHILADNGKVTCDGKACKLEDLKTGWKIRVTTKSGDRNVALRVEAINRNEQFEKSDSTLKDRNPERNPR